MTDVLPTCLAECPNTNICDHGYCPPHQYSYCKRKSQKPVDISDAEAHTYRVRNKPKGRPMQAVDIIKEPARTELESWHRWQNWIESQFRLMNHVGKRITILNERELLNKQYLETNDGIQYDFDDEEVAGE